nr:MFS transporter [Candidatus Sigynarchaeota archaeon]
MALEMKGSLLAKIYITKSLRVFSSALMSIVLPVALLADGYGLDFIGLITTLVILSNIPFNILLTFFIKHIGTRKILVLLSILMAASGMLFFSSTHPAIIVIAAILGMVSPNGTEVGPFQSVDQSLLSSIGTEDRRTLRLSMYNFIGYMAASAGSLVSGLPDFFSATGLSIQLLFLVYTTCAVIQGIIQASMKEHREEKNDGKKNVLDNETKKFVAKISALYSVDAFGGGFIVKILLVTWFSVRFGIALGSLSFIFFVADVITAISIITAPLVAKRIGLLKTMVLTHLLSNIFLICVPLAADLSWTVIFLFLRQSISQMDVPTRQSYMNAIIKPEDRAGSAAITNTVRTISQSISPPLATAFIDASQYVLPFVLGGGLKIGYDFAIYLVFRKMKPPEEKKGHI